MDNAAKIALLRKIRRAAAPTLVALFAWTLLVTLQDLYAVRPPKNGRAIPDSPSLANPGLAPLDESLSLMASRPMFKESVLYETKEPETVNALGDLTFLGVSREGGKLKAFLMNAKTKQSSLYAVGEKLEDLEIQEITEEKVLFTHGEEKLQLAK